MAKLKESVDIPLGVDHSKLGRDIKTTEEKISQALQRIEKSKRITLKMETALADKKLSELRAIHQKLLDNFNKKLKMDVDVKSLDAAKKRVEEVEKLMKRFKSDQEPDKPGITMKGMLKTAGALYGVSAGISQIKDAVKTYNEFDTKMRNVNTNINVSTEQLKGYSDQIRNLSQELGKPASELADAMYQATSAGMGAAESIGFVETASKAATAGITDTVTAVDGITSVLNAYQLSASEAGRISDIMFTTVRLGKTTFEQLSRQIADVTPIASSMGIKFEDVAGAIATMTKQGVPTEKATTQIRAAIQGMNKVLGDGWAKTMTLQEGFVKIREKAGGSDNKLREMIGTVEGMSAVLALTGKNASMAASDLNEMKNSLGATEKAYAMQADSLQVKMNKLNSSFDNLKISLVENFAPAVSWVLDNFADGLDRVMGKADDLEKMLNKNKGSHSQVYNDSLKGTTKEFRDSEIIRIQKDIEEKQKRYNKVNRLGVFADSDEKSSLRIQLAELRTYRQALKAYKDEVNETGSTLGKLNTAVGDTKEAKKAAKDKAAMERSYYEEVKFLDKNYSDYRLKQLNLEAQEYTKILGNRFNQELYLLEGKKKLNEEYSKWMLDKNEKMVKDLQEQLKKVPYGNLFSVNDKGELEDKRGSVGYNIPRKMGSKKVSDKPALSLGTAEDIMDEWIGATGVMRASFDSVVEGVTAGLNLIKIRTSESAGVMTRIVADMANMMLGELERIIAKWAILNILSAVAGGPGIGLKSMLGFGHDGGAFTASPSGAVKLATGGSLKIPGGYNNDSFGPVMVQSNELLKVYTPQQQIQNMRDYSTFVTGMNRLENGIRILNMNLINKNMNVTVINNATDVKTTVISQKKIENRMIRDKVNFNDF